MQATGNERLLAYVRNLKPVEMIGRRWIATVVDFVVVVVIGLAVIFGIPKGAGIAGGIALIVLILSLPFYYVIGEGIWGRTLGKFAGGVVVVDADGNPPGIGRALLRTVLRVIEVNPFVFGAIPAGIAVLASPNRQRLGDMAAGTFVVPHDFRSKIAPAQVFS